MPDPVRILAVDGGGIGGVIPAVVNSRPVSRHPGLLRNAAILAATRPAGGEYRPTGPVVVMGDTGPGGSA